MEVIEDIEKMQKRAEELRLSGETIAFVPTMGFFHEGHLELMRVGKRTASKLVISIFVNPIQFGPSEDYEKYPRDMEGDLKKLSVLKVDAVFTPDDKEMYPEGLSASIHVGRIGEILCGASRPGHFNGVATVVARLFNNVMPHRAYFGQKDLQQTVVIKKLVKDLNFDIDIIVCPTVREPDGLAMSSRNSYLNQKERKAATILYKALRHGEGLINKGINDSSQVKKEIESVIKSEPLAKIDYTEIVDLRSLDEMKKIKTPAAICLAVKIGRTRLIDNIIVD